MPFHPNGPTTAPTFDEKVVHLMEVTAWRRHFPHTEPPPITRRQAERIIRQQEAPIATN